MRPIIKCAASDRRAHREQPGVCPWSVACRQPRAERSEQHAARRKVQVQRSASREARRGMGRDAPPMGRAASAGTVGRARVPPGQRARCA